LGCARKIQGVDKIEQKRKKRFLMLKVRRPGISYNDNIKTEKYFKFRDFFCIKERGTKGQNSE